MDVTNQTFVTEFELVGFLDLQNIHTLFFVVLFVTYLLILSGNSLILILIQTNPRFHVPMYLFIAALAALEMCYTTVTIPKMLADLLQRKSHISFHGCLLQIYFFHALGITEACLLTVMAYDRYVAICTPLSYTINMTTKHCVQLVVGCCVCGFACPLPEIVLSSGLPFCESARLEHIFCDFPPLFSLACADVSTIVRIDFIVHAFVILGPVLLIVLSYGKILTVVAKIQSQESRQKALSTCASHLIVVLAFFGTTGFMYVRLTHARSICFERIITVIYAVLTPLFNPIVYSLRNEDIQAEIRNMFKAPAQSFQPCRHNGC